MNWILVDLQGVILKKPKKSTFDDWLKSHYAVKPREVNKLYNKLSWNLHKGLVSPKEVVAKINEHLNLKIPVKAFFDARVSGPIRVDKKVLDYIKMWKRSKYKIALVTDISRPNCMV